MELSTLILNYTKKNLTNLPFSVGRSIALLPYSVRPGLAFTYKSAVKEIKILESDANKKKYIFDRVSSLAKFSYKYVPFYHELYKSNNVDPFRLKDFPDIKALPVVSKAHLQEVDLEYRSCYRKGASLVNTRGSSGSTLDFYIEPSSVGHEWAHIHKIWSELGFKQSDY